MALIEFPTRRGHEQCPAGVEATADLERILIERFAEMEQERQQMRAELEVVKAERREQAQRADLLLASMATTFAYLASAAESARLTAN